MVKRTREDSIVAASSMGSGPDQDGSAALHGLMYRVFDESLKGILTLWNTSSFITIVSRSFIALKKNGLSQPFVNKWNIIIRKSCASKVSSYATNYV